MNKCYTSKKLVGKPCEPELVKKMMKTKLFKHSRQAGHMLMIFSLLCWVSIFFITLQHVNIPKIIPDDYIPLSDPVIQKDIDPNLLMGILDRSPEDSQLPDQIAEKKASGISTETLDKN